MRAFIGGIFLFTIVLIGVNTADAQVNEVTKEEIQDILRGSPVIVTRQKVEVTGSPYLYENFRSGKVTLLNGRETEELSMNYNIYENRIEYSDGNTILVIPAQGMQQFSFISSGETTRFKKGFSSNGLEENEFVMVLSEGNATALYKFEKNYQEAMASYGTAIQKDEYIDNSRLYIHSNGETNRIRRINERNLIRSLDSHRDAMREYLSGRNADLSTPDELKRFFDHYNQISG